jgi:LEA14-like dessication related protein
MEDNVATRMEKMVNLKRLPILVLLALAACAGLGTKFQKPNVYVTNVEMLGGNFLQQNFKVSLKIQNPNDRALPVNGLHAELKVSGESLATGVSNQAFVVPALGESEFDMWVTANMALALLKLATQRDKHLDTIDYDLTGAVSIDLPFLRDLPFTQHGSFSLGGGAGDGAS